MALPTQDEPSFGGSPRTSLTRPARIDVLWIGIAIAFVSASGPLITATVAPALAIAFWRCFIGSGATGVWVAFRARSEFRRLSKRQWKLIIVSGLLLGAHFATWVPSLRFTTVASATALVATQPVWAALIARARGVRIERSVWVGMTISLMGVLVLTGVDVSLDPRQLIGDVLALLGAMLSAAYFTVSAEARKTVSTSTLTFGLYGTSALRLVALCVLLAMPSAGARWRATICLVGWSWFVELAQPWFTDIRSRQFVDALGNTIGIVGMFLLMTFWARTRHRRAIFAGSERTEGMGAELR